MTRECPIVAASETLTSRAVLAYSEHLFESTHLLLTESGPLTGDTCPQEQTVVHMQLASRRVASSQNFRDSLRLTDFNKLVYSCRFYNPFSYSSCCVRCNTESAVSNCHFISEF